MEVEEDDNAGVFANDGDFQSLHGIWKNVLFQSIQYRPLVNFQPVHYMPSRIDASPNAIIRRDHFRRC